MSQIADCADLDILNGAEIVEFASQNAIDFVIVGSEAPLAAGVADHLRGAGILTFGPSALAAQLEASKAFTHEICDACGAPAAGYQRFTDLTSAQDYIREKGAPIVIKADGLAAGKGVIVAMTLQEALDGVRDVLAGRVRREWLREFLPATSVPVSAAQDLRRRS